MKTKCPNCGGNIAYSIKDVALVCEHCKTTTKIKSAVCGNIKIGYKIADSLVKSTSKFSHCNSCNSNLFTSSDKAITRCPNCGSVDIASQTGSQYKPHAILPLTVSREQAIQNFQGFAKHGHFRPNDFKKMAKLGELSVSYVPVYSFDTKTATIYKGVGVSTSNDNGKWETHRHNFNGTMTNSYSNVFISANASVGKNIIEGLEPWDFEKLRVYSDEFLFGVIGSNINIMPSTAFEKFNNYIKKAEVKKVKSKHNYSRYDSLVVNTQMVDTAFNCSYYPIYANYFSYKGKNYNCYVNGTTGKVCGEAPRSFWKIFGLIFGIAAGVAVTIITIVSLATSCAVMWTEAQK